jgi:2,3-bisphosphoglycerate-dependent phosphoglycerate mutase
VGDVPAGESINIDQYSDSLFVSKNERRAIRNERKRYSIIDDDLPAWQNALLTPVRPIAKVARKVGEKIGAREKIKPGSLILMRCGESEWTRDGRFTGWADPDLVEEGVLEVEHAGRLLLSEGYEPDIIYTSRLKRAQRSTWTMLNALSAPYLPVYNSWRLNERNYGALTGLRKADAARTFGVEVVQAWRNSLKARPPPMSEDDPYYPGNDRRYDDLTKDQIPLSESLNDCMERARPLWEYGIKKRLQKGNTVLVIAHTNTLRALMQVIDGIKEDDIKEVSMPGGIPFVYKFDSKMNPLPPPEGKISQAHTSGIFLEKPGLLKEALKRSEKHDSAVPGLNVPDESLKVKRVSTLEESLLKLKEEKVAEDSVGTAAIVNPNDDGQLIVTGMANGDSEAPVEDDGDEFEDFSDLSPAADPVTLNIQKADESSPGIVKQGLSNDPVVVFIRHGRTPHNNLGLFTGWEDPPLAPDGVEDAKNAGRLLKMHGFEFDVVYTSWLTRAIETAWYCVDELDETWLPMVKSWRLNERMYGALTGKSKQMIANEYGEDQLKKWRRGFKIQPPPVSSYSLSYPGNDYKRTKYVKDLRISLSETINRSWESKKLQIHRKFPKAESLWDCMQRSIPFYTQRIVPEAVDKGKRVLITSHENAIRGILMHLCEIPEEAMNQLHLPNGLPLVYNVKRKCITLLDDGSGKDPMEVHDFGPAAQYLFRPCELDDDFFDQMEQQALANQDAEATTDVKETVSA